MLERQTPVPAQEFGHSGPQKAEDLVQTAKSAPLSDGGIRTSQLLSEALSLDPSHHEALILQERLHQTFVPRWHFPMLSDTARNSAYAKAIAAKVKPGDVVLDIGCGAGLTAMLAARAGAKHVYTCEQQPLIAQAATQVIEANGLSDRITVIPKWSHEIVVGADIPEQADVVISEIVDTVLLGEGALATLTHAISALAKPDARAIPERGTLLAQPVESPGLLNLWRPHEAEGFDLSAFHHFARVAQLTPNDFEACKLRSLGPAAELFAFDFTRPNINPGRTTADLACAAAGTIHAVLVSFEMDLAPGIQVSNGVNSGGHWGRTAYLLDHLHLAAPGDRLRVTAQHDASQLSLSVQGALPRAAEQPSATLWMTRGWNAHRQLLADGGPAAPQAPVCPPSEAALARPQGQAFH
ncbi:50S ribosomal protein L11 methyltransferase [Leisingera sp. McT4-56]|uniref:50S ribosomal protein L11 methyltransferase n=1 Tax=Leisingera sp. McT4-56 TaxID=2881255 RepID=UPI001CF853EA|nr:50S ribosomal protein L11 methyltransferase [Leisingera sp. McT4-56]MCB4454957.1 50S ribosomal protein L11 methyltransferase [Leisingera sp. McT4-56]